MKTIFVGADHAGFALKEEVKKYLKKQKHRVVDIGSFVYDKHDDYPDVAFKLAKKAVLTKSLGILVCGSSFGVCIAANKVKGARAVSLEKVSDAKLARQHNDANILCLSGWNSTKTPTAVIHAFITIPFSKSARHKRRIAKISQYEK